MRAGQRLLRHPLAALVQPPPTCSGSSRPAPSPTTCSISASWDARARSTWMASRTRARTSTSRSRSTSTTARRPRPLPTRSASRKRSFSPEISRRERPAADHNQRKGSVQVSPRDCQASPCWRRCACRRSGSCGAAFEVSPAARPRSRNRSHGRSARPGGQWSPAVTGLPAVAAPAATGQRHPGLGPEPPGKRPPGRDGTLGEVVNDVGLVEVRQRPRARSSVVPPGESPSRPSRAAG